MYIVLNTCCLFCNVSLQSDSCVRAWGNKLYGSTPHTFVYIQPGHPQIVSEIMFVFGGPPERSVRGYRSKKKLTAGRGHKRFIRIHTCIYYVFMYINTRKPARQYIYIYVYSSVITRLYYVGM